MTDENTRPSRDQTHRLIEDAIATHMANIGLPGILSSWSLVGNLVYIDEDDQECETLYQTSSANISRWQNIGLLTDALENSKYGGMREIMVTDEEDED